MRGVKRGDVVRVDFELEEEALGFSIWIQGWAAGVEDCEDDMLGCFRGVMGCEVYMVGG